MSPILISASTLRERLAANEPHLVVLDASFDLTDPAAGERAHAAGHVPGAIYLHLDRDLSAPKTGQNGRHPLPSREAFAARLGELGVGAASHVVCCDGQGGMYAARLWWMLRWLGHDAVALLDGDWRRWRAEGRATHAGVENRAPRTFTPRLRPHLQATVDELLQRRADSTLRLFDARAADRYRGENESLDPVAGHIPGAINAPYALNLDAGGSFLSPCELRARYEALLGDTPAAEAIFYCGSGVSAVHDLLALEVAGLGMGRLYAGSWSEWIADPQRPVATGATP